MHLSEREFSSNQLLIQTCMHMVSQVPFETLKGRAGSPNDYSCEVAQVGVAISSSILVRPEYVNDISAGRTACKVLLGSLSERS